MIDEGVAAPMATGQRVTYRLWWPIRLALWFCGGLSDTTFMVGIGSHPQKPFMVSMVDARFPEHRGFACQAMTVASARKWGEQIISMCDQYETWKEMAKNEPAPELAKGTNGEH